MAGNEKPRTLFLALDTYSRVGGIQRFNKRIISTISSKSAFLGASIVHIMRDNQTDVDNSLNVTIKGFGPARLRFIISTVLSALNTDIVFIGHINLLPVFAICKIINPKLKSVLFVHGDDVWDENPYRRRKFYEPALLRFVTRISSVSQYTARKMSLAFAIPSSKFFILPNAVDPTEPSSKRTKEFVLTVSRLDYHDRGKNIDAIIKAIALLRAKNTDISLRIVGDGPIRQELEVLAKELGVTDLVTFLGRVSDDILISNYEEASAFVLPSSKEGFGIVYLEAWQYNLPVICGTDDAASEIISEGVDGFAVSPADINLLSERLSFLAKEKQISEQMGNEGKQKVGQYYLDHHFQENFFRLVECLA